MLDAKKLLDQFLGAGTADKFGQQAGGMLTRADEFARGKATQMGKADTYQSATDLIKRHAGGFAGGAAAGALAGLLLGGKGGRKMAGSALKLGGLAVLGGLAYKAYSDYQSGRPVLGGVLGGGQPQAPQGGMEMLPAPAGSGFEPAAQDPLLLVRTMIAAAKADGVIDEAERNTILAELDRGGVDAEARGFLEGELANPAAPEALAAQARTPQQAAEIYTAALLAIDPDTPSEKAWVARLAASLKLDAQLVAHIDAATAQARAG